ncbi:hypothetical protein APUTEX25_002147, partial [Auxenochlorella protothecoides]
ARSHTSSSTAGVPLWGSSLLSLSDSLSTSWPSPITVSPSSTAMARGSGGARKLQDPGHAWLRTRPQISKAEGRPSPTKSLHHGDGSRYAAGSLKGVGIPVKLIHEAEGHIVSVELKTGEIFRGELHDAEDNWNVQLSNITATGRDGKVSHMEHIFIRGSQIRFIIIPDMLKNAPMFKRIDPKNKMKNVALGMGGRGRGGRP